MAIEICMAVCAAMTSRMIPQMGRGQAANRVNTLTPIMCMKTGPGWLSKKKPLAISAGRRFFATMIGIPSEQLSYRQAVHHGFKPLGAYFVTGKGKGDPDTENGTDDPESQGKRAHIRGHKQVDDGREGL